MKKLFILFTFILLTINVKAAEYYDFKFTKDNIYDYADIFSEIEQEKLTKKIKEFELKSSIDLSIITVSTHQEIYNMSNKLSNMKVKNNKSILIPSLVIIYSKDGEVYIISNEFYNKIWDKNTLKRFNAYKVNNYDEIFLYSNELELMIDDWIKYYDNENLINIVLILILSSLITLVIIKTIEKKYKPKLIIEADKYINIEKIIVK